MNLRIFSHEHFLFKLCMIKKKVSQLCIFLLNANIVELRLLVLKGTLALCTPLTLSKFGFPLLFLEALDRRLQQCVSFV